MVLLQDEIFVSSVILVVVKKLEKKTEFAYAPIKGFAMWNIKEKPENVAWMTLIELLELNPQYTKELKVGIIVDSDLGNISDYNSGVLPIYGNFFLPINMKLIYGSSDRGKEHFANRLIALADKQSKNYISEAKLQGESLTTDEYLKPLSVENKPYTHFKVLF